MSKDYFYNDHDDETSYQKTVAMCIAAASLVVLIFLIILYMNTKDNKAKEVARNVTLEETTEDDFLAQSHNFTSDDLDFWKDANLNEPEKKKDPDGQKTPFKNAEEDESTEDSIEEGQEGEEATEDNDEQSNPDADNEELNDENHISVTTDDGKQKYYEIMSEVDKNEYDFNDSLKKDGGILNYNDSKIKSIKGIDISNRNGNIDFAKVKDDGVAFAMLRLGNRNSVTGVIELDDKFVEYAQNANLNAINIGAYFTSQAISEAEAIEEANYIVGAIGGFNIKYPVAIDLGSVKDESSRAKDVTLKDRTQFIKKFCETVKSYGYQPVIHASRDILIAGLDLSELTEYDVWLSDTTIPTDFPYMFTMWQYNKKGEISGIDGTVNINLLFSTVAE